MRRENQHAHFGGAVIGPEAREDPPTVEAGETDVENDDVRYRRPGSLETHQSVFGRPDFGTGRAQADIDEPPHAGGVFDHEH
jgi:hypothetical protein